MTRINLVPPKELMDQHLIAEYREIRLLTANLRRSFSTTGATKRNIPRQFTLNSGHILFFKDKGKYIERRYQLLREEMHARGFETNFDTIDTSVWPVGFFNDWEPSERDMNIVRDRIKQKIALRPNWYRFYGKRI